MWWETSPVCGLVPLHPEHEPRPPVQHLLHGRRVPVIVYNSCCERSGSVCVCVRAICGKKKCQFIHLKRIRLNFDLRRRREAGGRGPLGAADPTLPSRRVPVRRHHLPGRRQAGLKTCRLVWDSAVAGKEGVITGAA